MRISTLLPIGGLWLAAATAGFSQQSPGSDTKPQQLKPLNSAAWQARVDAVDAVLKGGAPEAGLGVLRGSLAAASGSAKSNLDLGWAAIDVGMRLASKGRSTDAAVFFNAAEQALTKAAAAASEKDTSVRVQALYALAHVQSVYLHKYVEADDALAEASRLAPEDDTINQAKQRFDGQFGEVVKTARKNSKH